MSVVGLYPDGNIPDKIRALAVERLHGGPSLATPRKGYSREQRRIALLLVRDWNRDQAFWRGEQLILLGVDKDRDISELEIRVPINIQTRKPRIQTRRSKR